MKYSDKNVSDQIIEGCLKGDRISQKILFETFYGKMMVVALRYAEDGDEAKDMLQDGFIKVFNKLSAYNGVGSFEGWIRRIIVNTCIDVIRRKKINLSTDDIEDVPMDEEDEEEAFSGIQVSDVISEVQKLSPGYRSVLNLYLFEGYTHNEIGEALGISSGTSKSNYAKAKRKLRNALEQKIAKVK